MKDSDISWTVHTYNPWVGCAEVSPGCRNCYAAPIARRLGVEWGPHGERRRAAASTLRQPHAWNRAARKERQPAFVFCASMADVFDNKADSAWREELFATIRATPWLTYQLLTKRPQNVRKMLPPDWGEGYPNVWLGVSAENQEEAERRLPVLLEVPARVRLVSGGDPEGGRAALAGAARGAGAVAFRLRRAAARGDQPRAVARPRQGVMG